MKPYNDTLTRAFLLDNPAKAADELTTANQEAILLVLLNNPQIDERTVRGANRAARPVSRTPGENEPLKQVIVIQDPAVQAAVEDPLKAVLPDGTDFAQTVALALVKGTGAVAHVISKGNLTGFEMGTAFNMAIIELGKSKPA